MSEVPIPKDPRHLKFADFILDGVPAASAYRQAGYVAKSAQVASASSSRLLKNASICAYINAVRQLAVSDKVLSLQMKREFLCRIVRTPLMSINPNDAARLNGDLILKYKRTFRVSGEDEDTVTEEIVKLDPLKAIDLDNKLSGDDPEANALGSLASALAGLAGGGAVEDRM